MGGIVFVQTADREAARKFYVEGVGMEPWIEQPGISILRHGNMLVGFQDADSLEACATGALLTFVLSSRGEVDRMHDSIRDQAEGPPRENARYRIYNFYARDPDGRRIEFQAFLHPLPDVPLLRH